MRFGLEEFEENGELPDENLLRDVVLAKAKMRAWRPTLHGVGRLMGSSNGWPVH